MKQNIIFFGSGWFVIPVVKKLRSHGLELVVTNETQGNLIEFCKTENIPFVSSDLKDSETIEKIKNVNPRIAILASYGAFIPDEVITIFPEGIINIHPSLLPKYKGPSPVQYQLLNGETIVGVTLIKLDDQIDHGPIISQKPYNVVGNETAEDLLSILFEIGSDMVVEEVKKLENGEELLETPQDHSHESWSYKITKQDGNIDLNTQSAKPFVLKNMVKAFYPWPGVWFKTTLKGQIKLVKLLPEDKIQVEGKNPMSYKDFMNGFGEEGSQILQKLSLI